MNGRKKFGIPVLYNSRMDILKGVIDVYLLFNPPKKKFFNRAKEALAYYLMYGFNKETVEDVETMLSDNINKQYVTTINSFLRKNGFLIKDERNKNKSHLSKDMLQIRNEYVKNDGKLLTIGFIKKKNE